MQVDASEVSAGEERGSVPAGLRVFRVTTPADVARVKPLAREYHAESRYSHIPFSGEKFIKVYSRLVDSPRTIFLYVQYDNQPVGLLGAEIGDYFLGQGGRIATSYVIYVSGSIRRSLLGGKVSVRLLRLFLDWAKAQGAEEVNVHATSGIEPEHTDRFMRKLGFEFYGGNYSAAVR